MISLVWAIFRGSRTLQAATAILAGWIAWSANNTYQRHQGASRVIETSKQVGAIANAKNQIVRRAAALPGAASRLQHSVCRDCGRQALR
jgi:hypothetical protein